MFLALKVETIIIIVVLVIALLLLVTFSLIFLISKKKANKSKVDEIFIANLLEALGNRTNITDIKVIQGRLNITVNDLDLCNLEVIKSLATNGVFVTGSTIKVLMREDSNLIKEQLLK